MRPNSKNIGPNTGEMEPHKRVTGPCNVDTGPNNAEIEPHDRDTKPFSNDAGPTKKGIGSFGRQTGAYSSDSGANTRDRNTHNRDSQALKREVDTIRLSLDVLKDTLIMQQYVLARDFEARIRIIYDDVINDLNGIRKRVNDLGNTFKSETKFRTWTPLMPIRKDVLPSALSTKSSTKNKLKGSKSVDFVDQRGTDDYDSSEIDFDKFQSKKIFSQRQSWLGSSQSSINSTGSSRKLVSGFGGCFDGDGKTIPYRSYRARHNSNRTNRHSWGPSRSASRSTLDDDDGLNDKGCLCGEVTEDWRVKVAPYMWKGWPVPGIDSEDVHKLRERMEHLEKMRHEIVHVHNEYRHQHGCPHLSVTTQLAREAQQWADLLAMRGFAQYNDYQGRGENILVVDIEDNLSGRQIVDTWYRESRSYNYNRPGWRKETTNFTQMIWKSSRYVGVGIAKFPSDNTYVIVVQYQPQGNVNIPTNFRRNVPPVTAEKTSVLQNFSPLQNTSFIPYSELATEVKEQKLSKKSPCNECSAMKEESSITSVEVNEHLVKPVVKSNTEAISRFENTVTNTQSNGTDGLHKLVAGLDIVIQNLTGRKRSDSNYCASESKKEEENEEEAEHDILQDVGKNGIEGQSDVGGIEKHNADADTDDVVNNDDFKDDCIIRHSDINDDVYNNENDDDGDDYGGGRVDNDYNDNVDNNDFIASVSASLASSVYDGTTTDQNNIIAKGKFEERVIQKLEQDRVLAWSSGKTVDRQTSRDRKVTSV